jgi:putative oxidoreductase
MEQFTKCYTKFTNLFDYVGDLGQLALRFVLAYTFFSPAMMKLSDINSTASWFGYMGIPFPTLNAYMAAGTEALGVVLLTLGLLTRFISIPLIITMIVAIITVHGSNGFAFVQEGSEVVDPWINGTESPGTYIILQNGYELVMYYIIMLVALVGKGSGRISLDYLLFERKK